MRTPGMHAFVGASTALVLLLCLACIGEHRLQAAQKTESVVKASANADKPDAQGKQVVTITLAMDSGWHTYANPTGNDTFAENETKVAFSANGKPLEAKLDYPEGNVVVDSVTGNYKVYKDKVTIKATVQRAKGDASPLQVSVKVQACNDKTCLLPTTLKLNVP
jgi:uncharacterized protein